MARRTQRYRGALRVVLKMVRTLVELDRMTEDEAQEVVLALKHAGYGDLKHIVCDLAMGIRFLPPAQKAEFRLLYVRINCAWIARLIAEHRSKR